MPFRELPQLVQILTEAGLRMQEVSALIGRRNDGSVELMLKRVDDLLAETEANLKALSVVLDVMVAQVFQHADGDDLDLEPDAAAAKRILKLKWEDVLPIACFSLMDQPPVVGS